MGREDKPIIEIKYEEPKVNLETQPDFRDLAGMIPTITVFPTWTPRKLSECVAVYDATTVYKWCVYVNNTWRSVNLT